MVNEFIFRTGAAGIKYSTNTLDDWKQLTLQQPWLYAVQCSTADR